MGASPQSLRHQFSIDPLAAAILSFGGLWHVLQVGRKEAEVEQSSWKKLADWLDGFLVVLEALSMHWEMTAILLNTGEGGRVETRHYQLGAGHILAMVAQNLEILGLCCW